MIEPSLRLRRAIHANSPLLVSRILKTHPTLLHNPDATPLGLSNTSLHLAAHLGHLAIAQLLLSLGHERDTISLNEEYATPLLLAASAGHTEIVHLLCTSCPGSIGKRDVRGRDAIMEASRGGHDTCVQILLTFGTSTSTSSINSTSSTAETISSEELLKNADLDGNTALHFASSNGHLLVLRTLLAAGADSERRNVWSWRPVAYSATVQAEVYFKGLAGEVERRRRRKEEVVGKGVAGGLRVVGEDDE